MHATGCVRKVACYEDTSTLSGYMSDGELDSYDRFLLAPSVSFVESRRKSGKDHELYKYKKRHRKLN